MAESKTLYLMRHAKAGWPKPGKDDFDRPLNKCGQADAPEMGRRLKEREVRPDLIVCSPAARTRETLQLMQLDSENIVFNESIYEAAASSLLEIVRSLDERLDSAMIIGHNPAISWLASQLGGVNIGDMPAGAVATIRFNTRHWEGAAICPAELLDFDYPGKTAPPPHSKINFH